jgi:hypothetical protein
MIDMPGFQSDYSHARSTFHVPPRKWWEYSFTLSWLAAEASVLNPYFPGNVPNLNVLVLVRPDIAVDSSRGCGGQLGPEMIATFKRNTRNFILIARAHGIIPVLSTQTIVDDAAGNHRWFRSLERLNQVIRDLATSESVGLIDFALQMPWNPVDYCDPCHLRDTPGGLGRQAQIFAQGLIAMRTIEQAWERRQTDTSGQIHQ